MLPDCIHPADLSVVKNDTDKMVRSLLAHISNTTVTVNDYSCARAAEDKVRQLEIALSIGFRIPSTLVSNDPIAIRDFISSPKHAFVCKPLKQTIWKKSNGDLAVSMTNRVRLESLPSDATLKLAPMIFQREVAKKYEIRVTCMGGYIHATRLNSQDTCAGELDWRATSPSNLSIAEYHLPVEIQDRCRNLLGQMGLKFGCIDLIFTTDDEYIFLEINQMGQFLWIEQFGTNIQMLDHFCSFLLCGDRSYDAIPTVRSGGFKNLQARIESVLTADLRYHDSKTLASNVFLEA